MCLGKGLTQLSRTQYIYETKFLSFNWCLFHDILKYSGYLKNKFSDISNIFTIIETIILKVKDTMPVSKQYPILLRCSHWNSQKSLRRKRTKVEFMIWILLFSSHCLFSHMLDKISYWKDFMSFILAQCFVHINTHKLQILVE